MENPDTAPLQYRAFLLGEDKYAGQKSEKPDKKCILHWAFARPLKVLATLGNSFFAGVGEVRFLIC